MHVPLDEDDRRRGESDGDRFFQGLTENVFYGLMGIADPPLVEYISSLLVRFIRNDIFYELPGAPGVAVTDLTDMLTDAQKRSGAQARKEYRHIGDYTLFWTGVYPEALRKFQGPVRKDYLLDYRQSGKRAYLIASSIRSDALDKESELLQRLSHEYESCVEGLGQVRRAWEGSSGHGVP